MAFVNATDSSATSNDATTTIGNTSFQDLFSQAFVVGRDNAASTDKTNTATQTQQNPTLKPTISNAAGYSPAALSYPDAIEPRGIAVSPLKLALLGGGVLVLGVVAFLVIRRK